MWGRRPFVVAIVAAAVSWSVIPACVPPPQQSSSAYSGPPGAYTQPSQQTAGGCTSNTNCGSGQVCLKENAYQAGSCVDGCSSDFSCSFGSKCVKGPYEYTGVCAKTVDEYGTPTYDAPSGDSVGPGDDDGDCGFDTDCAFGFRCVKQGYALRGNCMK